MFYFSDLLSYSKYYLVLHVFTKCSYYMSQSVFIILHDLPIIVVPNLFFPTVLTPFVRPQGRSSLEEVSLYTTKYEKRLSPQRTMVI